MKRALGVWAFATVSLAVSALVAGLAADAAAQSISGETEVTGLTLTMILGGLIVAGGLLVRGSRMLFQLGGEATRWRTALESASALVALAKTTNERAEANAAAIARQAEAIAQQTEAVRSLAEEVAALQRWRASADPLLAAWRRRSGWAEEA